VEEFVRNILKWSRKCKALVTNPTLSANLLKTTCGAAASNFARA